MIEIKEIDRENIQYFIYNLENFEKDKAIRSGLRSAVNVFRVKGRANLRSRILRHGKQTNHLMNSFTNRVKRNKLGALSGFARPGGNHAHLVDAGTKVRRTKGEMCIRDRCVTAYLSADKLCVNRLGYGSERYYEKTISGSWIQRAC